ncbi:MAG: hypothetical protein AXA67_04410 [Methylothermaceae bacteria B42]|nr:MAG: hypothetical protein AXA67_04410 [Methylothermaceae bacteria B42]HHJ39930.1 hypothetical protein [Methylothermaceae bacterium]
MSQDKNKSDLNTFKSQHENSDIEKEVEALFSKWKKDDDKIDARRKVEEYMELKRLKEQIGDDLVMDED